MGRRKGSSGGGALGMVILAAIAVIIQYWQYILLTGAIALVLYLIVKSIKDSHQSSAALSPSSNNHPSGITVSVELTSRSSTRRLTKHSVIFYDSEQPIEISGSRIPAYLLYVGESPDTLPHLVRPSLPVGHTKIHSKDRMGYWPDYERISEKHRANYLDWLSGGRSDPSADIGLVFLYFYGLEYRCFHEKRDQKKILFELIRLYEIYAQISSSFEGYCWRFIKAIILTSTEFSSSEMHTLEKFLETARVLSPKEDVSEVQSHLISNGKPSWDAIYDFFVASHRTETWISKLEHFSQHRIKFTQLAPQIVGSLDALDVLERRKSTYQYRSASSLMLNAEIPTDNWEPTTTLTRKLKKLWTKSTEALIEDWIGRTLQETQDRIIAIDRLAEHLASKTTKIIGVKDARMIAEILENAGLLIEPDARLTGRGYKRGEDVIVYKPETQLPRCDTERYYTASLLLDLGLQVCQAGGEINEVETKTILDFLGNAFCKTGSERERLTKRAALISFKPAISSGIAKKLGEHLAVKESETVIKFLISAAAADGTIQVGEFKALTKIFKDLGIPQGRLEAIMSEMNAEKSSDKVALRKENKSSREGSAIPQVSDSESEAEVNNKGIALNPELLKQILADTAGVSEVLSKTFATEQSDTYVAPVINLPVGEGLDDTHRRFVRLLLTKDEWPPEELREQAKEMGLMLSGAIAKINEWSDEELGDFLIDEGATYKVRRELLESVEGGLSSA